MSAFGVLEECRKDGFIGHYAASNWSAARLEAVHRLSANEGFAGFVANQPEWDFARRNPGSSTEDVLAMDGGMFDLHQRIGLACIPYSSQAKGYFDKALSGDDVPSTNLT